MMCDVKMWGGEIICNSWSSLIMSFDFFSKKKALNLIFLK